MFTSNHYVPILMGRQGEYTAMAELSDEARSRMTPLIAVPPVPYDFANEREARTVEEHVRGTAEKIKKAWGERPFFLDSPWLVMDAGGVRHAIESVFDECRSEGLAAIPVTGPSRPLPFHEAVRRIHQADGRGICMRVEPEDFEDPFVLAAQMDELLSFFRIRRQECDLILDFKSVPSTVGPMVLAVISTLAAMPALLEWRTITWAGTAFPENMSSVSAGSVHPIPRTEWEIWTTLTQRQSIPRFPSYGDYAISFPEPTEIDPRMMRMSANLRYTADQKYGTWLILKGRNVRDHGFDQFRGLCRALVLRPEYPGPGYSWADAFIKECAEDKTGPGNATTWRKIGTNRHLTVITRDLASRGP